MVGGWWQILSDSERTKLRGKAWKDVRLGKSDTRVWGVSARVFLLQTVWFEGVFSTGLRAYMMVFTFSHGFKGTHLPNKFLDSRQKKKSHVTSSQQIASSNNRLRKVKTAASETRRFPPEVTGFILSHTWDGIAALFAHVSCEIPISRTSKTPNLDGNDATETRVFPPFWCLRNSSAWPVLAWVCALRRCDPIGWQDNCVNVQAYRWSVLLTWTASFYRNGTFRTPSQLCFWICSK